MLVGDPKRWWVWLVAIIICIVVDRWTGFHGVRKVKVKTERRYSRDAEDEN